MAGFHLDDTIAAVSTAMAPAGIGIVRISGNDAFEVADRVFRAKKEGKKLSAVKSHTIHYGWITEGEEVIDEVLVMVMKGPKTYTGENTVEIDCHGGVLAVKKVLEAVLHAGARAADPGEFTKRAFLNGRMDLTQAEAVMDLIADHQAACRFGPAGAQRFAPHEFGAHGIFAQAVSAVLIILPKPGGIPFFYCLKL